jgi:hypothetical protein
VLDTITLHGWLRREVEAGGLAAAARVVWWVHELGAADWALQGRGIVVRHLLVNVGAAAFDSEASRRLWAAWVLEEVSGGSRCVCGRRGRGGLRVTCARIHALVSLAFGGRRRNGWG